MVIVAMIMLTLLGVFFLFLAVMGKIWGYREADFILVLGLITLALILTLPVYDHHKDAGRPYSLHQLADNQIYERVGDGGIRNSQGNYVVLVKSQSGEERCYELTKVPPKFFKVVSTARGREIVPYPPDK